LVQPSSGLDVTEKLREFARNFFGQAGDVDGFLLKSRSPSCGIQDVRIYGTTEKSAALGKAAGLFAADVLERFPDLAIEEEGRLRNFNLREHFLTRVFCIARLRQLAARPSRAALVEFQARHKFLLMAYDETRLRRLGRIVANSSGKPLADVVSGYRCEFLAAFAKPARYTAHVNVLQHAFGYVSDELNAAERRVFLSALERYRKARLPLSSVLAIVRAWIARFDQQYLARQFYFQPFPEDLIELSDSGKPRLD